MLTRWLINYAGKRAVRMDACKMVDSDAVIGRENSPDVEVSRAVLYWGDGVDFSIQVGFLECGDNSPASIDSF